MKKPIISVDIDDVLADTTERIRSVVNEVTGQNLTKEQYQVRGEYWGYYEKVWKDAGIDHMITFAELDKLLIEGQSHISAKDSAHEVLSGLQERYDFILVTSRDELWKQATLAWIEERFSGVFEGLYFTGDRHGASYRSKGELCADHGVFMHIDDSTSHCQSVIDQGIRTILFGQYGWQADTSGDQVRCKTWREVGDYLATL